MQRLPQGRKSNTQRAERRSEETYLENQQRRCGDSKERSKDSVNQRAGDVAEVLHLFDQDRESAVQRNKPPEED